jgi:hypothetical protein
LDFAGSDFHATRKRAAAMMATMRSTMLTGTFIIGMVGAVTYASPSHAVIIRTGCAGGDFGPACSLAELVRNGGSIQIDDKIFEGWAVVPTGTRPFNQSGVQLSELGEGTNNRGLAFDMAPPSSFRVTPGQTQLTNISFLLKTARNQPTITDNELTVTAFGRGRPDASITETLSNGVTKSVTGVTGGTFARRTFDPVPLLGVTTVVNLNGGTGGSGTEPTFVNRFTQTFSQVPVRVPEPSPILLLVPGLLGLAIIRDQRERGRDARGPLR